MSNYWQRGLTAIELVIVLTLSGVLLGLSAVSIRGAVAREELNGWSRTIVHELTAAHQAAVTRRASVTVSFQDQTFTVALTGGGGTLRRQTLPAHVTFGSPLQSVTFDRRGTPSGVSSITLSSTLGGPVHTIVIEPGTGRASRQ